jgi:cyclopropane fatty-acyl-phospholipid synthase-like methyltransferase
MACYALAPPRVRQYLEAETDHVLAMIHPGDIVLELGCGYGRILPLLARKARFVIGITCSMLWCAYRMASQLFMSTSGY